MFKRLFVYMVLMTWVLTMLDWKPIHYAWWHYGEYPAYARDWQTWTNVRMGTARILCPPCAPLAENYYYVLMEVEAGTNEPRDVLQVQYSGNPVAPHGYQFFWAQGAGQAWRPVSMLSLYLYWLPSSVIWWLVVGDLFRWKSPWWWKRLTLGAYRFEAFRKNIKIPSSKLTNSTTCEVPVPSNLNPP